VATTVLPLPSQVIDQPGVLGAFAGTVDAFETDEATTRHENYLL
jgi:hypothetical protein